LIDGDTVWYDTKLLDYVKMGWVMKLFVRHITLLVITLGFSTAVFADETQNKIQLYDLDFTQIDLMAPSSLLAANDARSRQYRSSVPNIPDSAFEKPGVTENNLHMYLGLASLAMGGLAAISAPDTQEDLLNTYHFKAAKASWQLGAAAVASGFYTHWDDFHLEDGLLDRDNLHVLLGLVGTLGYYLAVKGAVDEFNDKGAVTADSHASKGIMGGASMTFAIGFTW